MREIGLLDHKRRKKSKWKNWNIFRGEGGGTQMKLQQQKRDFSGCVIFTT